MNEKNEQYQFRSRGWKIRDQIISKIGDKPLDEVNQIIKKLLMKNMDETMRLAALAARVKLLEGKFLYYTIIKWKLINQSQNNLKNKKSWKQI